MHSLINGVGVYISTPSSALKIYKKIPSLFNEVAHVVSIKNREYGIKIASAMTYNYVLMMLLATVHTSICGKTCRY